MPDFNLEDALRLCFVFHRGQKYSEGTEQEEDYFLHVLRVLVGLDVYRKYYPKLDWNMLRIVAALHDTMEDCGATRQNFLEYGVQERAIDLIEMLTRDKEKESYEEYILRVKTDTEASLVKLSDLQTNINHSYSFGERGRKLRERWQKAKGTLLDVLLLENIDLT